ncbi:salicylate hydroxylase [Stachybotrys elegans]|uniref:Salicylate hydroxylase n=1 Tax=Stachybotrys elegans TaxID=80388 RepID=A0A8K0T202_9HYPO|nr:salicylate hydroxylase [Stachybotrys elegans]
MTVNSEFNVAIVGAGVAGLALAMGLHRKGVPFTIYEEASQYSVVGAGIGFGPNGMQALDMIQPGFRPLYEALCVGNKPDNAQWVFFEGLLLEPGFGDGQPWNGNLKSAWGHKDYLRKSAHRKELLDIMTSFIPIETVKFSKKLVSIKEYPDKVTLEFADGDVATHSILVGGDGIASIVREYILTPTHPEEAKPVYSGAHCYRAVIPMEEASEIMGEKTDVAKIYFGHNRGAVSYRITGGKELNFLLIKATPNESWPHPGRVTQPLTREEMLADFDGDNIDDRFRRLVAKAKPVKWGLFHHQKTSTYYKDRVCLLGDSAHASMPFQAAGAAQGVEDALILAFVLEELMKSPTRGAKQLGEINIGLKAYDAVRRPRAQKQLDRAFEVGKMIYFQHPECGSDMNKILDKLQNGWLDWLWFPDLKADVDRALSQMRKELQK